MSLPEGWAWTTVGETGQYINGFAFKPTHRGIEGKPIVRIQNLTNVDRPLHRTTEKVPPAFHVTAGDILVSWSATLDAFIWQREDALLNQHIFRVVPNDDLIDRRLLYYWLRQAIADLRESAHMHGSTMAHINRGPFLAHRVPLPPKRAQGRIADRLDELFSDIDAAETELLQAQRKLTLYRQSLLKSVVDGSLTAAWRAERGESPALPAAFEFDAAVSGSTPMIESRLPPGWVWSTVRTTGDVQLGRQRSPRFHVGDNMLPYLRVANVFEERIDTTDVMKMHFSAADEARFRLLPGDVLLNEGQSPELVGRPAIFKGELDRVCFTNTLIRYRPYAGVDGSYALLVFLHYLHSGIFRALAPITTNIAHLGAGRFAEAPFPLPPIDEQREIVARFEEARQAIRAQAAAIDRALAMAAAQRQNVLNAAFSGRLVPQDPNEEPASVLLDRIRAQRAAATKPAHSRQPRSKGVVST